MLIKDQSVDYNDLHSIRLVQFGCMQKTHAHNFGLTASESVLVFSGVLILASAIAIVTYEYFLLWRAAKVVYTIGLFGLLIYPGE